MCIGQRKEHPDLSVLFRVAEQSAAEAAKKYADAPLKLIKFYKAYGLYLDAQVALEKWLTQHPHDARALRIKKDIESLMERNE